MVSSKMLAIRGHFSYLLLAYAVATFMNVKVSGMAVEKDSMYNIGQQQPARKCDLKTLGEKRSPGLHDPDRHSSSTTDRNFTVARLIAAAPADCAQTECPTGAACDPPTSICDIECGFYPHELFCDCFYHCDGCDRPVVNPCPDGTMYHVDERCCATASLVDCDGRIPYWDYEFTTTDAPAETTTGQITTTAAMTTTAEITTSTPVITTTTAVAVDTTTEEQKTTTQKQTTTAGWDTTTTTERTTTERQTTSTEKQTTTAQQTTTEQKVTTTHAATTTENKLTTLHQIDFKCPHDGYFAYPTSCHCFIECISGIAITVVCPTNMEYDPSVERCRAPWGCDPLVGSLVSPLNLLDPCPL